MKRMEPEWIERLLDVYERIRREEEVSHGEKHTPQ